jgi:hypothetical protein
MVYAGAYAPAYTIFAALSSTGWMVNLQTLYQELEFTYASNSNPLPPMPTADQGQC